MVEAKKAVLNSWRYTSTSIHAEEGRAHRLSSIYNFKCSSGRTLK